MHRQHKRHGSNLVNFDSSKITLDNSKPSKRATTSRSKRAKSSTSKNEMQKVRKNRNTTYGVRFGDEGSISDIVPMRKNRTDNDDTAKKHRHSGQYKDHQDLNSNKSTVPIKNHHRQRQSNLYQDSMYLSPEEFRKYGRKSSPSNSAILHHQIFNDTGNSSKLNRHHRRSTKPTDPIDNYQKRTIDNELSQNLDYLFDKTARKEQKYVNKEKSLVVSVPQSVKSIKSSKPRRKNNKAISKTSLLEKYFIFENKPAYNDDEDIKKKKHHHHHRNIDKSSERGGITSSTEPSRSGLTDYVKGLPSILGRKIDDLMKIFGDVEQKNHKILENLPSHQQNDKKTTPHSSRHSVNSSFTLNNSSNKNDFVERYVAEAVRRNKKDQHRAERKQLHNSRLLDVVKDNLYHDNIMIKDQDLADEVNYHSNSKNFVCESFPIVHIQPAIASTLNSSTSVMTCMGVTPTVTPIKEESIQLLNNTDDSKNVIELFRFKNYYKYNDPCSLELRKSISDSNRVKEEPSHDNSEQKLPAEKKISTTTKQQRSQIPVLCSINKDCSSNISSGAWRNSKISTTKISSKNDKMSRSISNKSLKTSIRPSLVLPNKSTIRSTILKPSSSTSASPRSQIKDDNKVVESKKMITINPNCNRIRSVAVSFAATPASIKKSKTIISNNNTLRKDNNHQAVRNFNDSNRFDEAELKRKKSPEVVDNNNTQQRRQRKLSLSSPPASCCTSTFDTISTSNSLFLTKDYRTTSKVSSYEKRKLYGDELRRKMQKRSSMTNSRSGGDLDGKHDYDCVPPQVFEVRYMTTATAAENATLNLSLSSTNSVASFESDRYYSENNLLLLNDYYDNPPKTTLSTTDVANNVSVKLGHSGRHRRRQNNQQFVITNPICEMIHNDYIDDVNRPQFYNNNSSDYSDEDNNCLPQLSNTTSNQSLVNVLNENCEFLRKNFSFVKPSLPPRERRVKKDSSFKKNTNKGKKFNHQNDDFIQIVNDKTFLMEHSNQLIYQNQKFIKTAQPDGLIVYEIQENVDSNGLSSSGESGYDTLKLLPDHSSNNTTDYSFHHHKKLRQNLNNSVRNKANNSICTTGSSELFHVEVDGGASSGFVQPKVVDGHNTNKNAKDEMVELNIKGKLSGEEILDGIKTCSIYLKPNKISSGKFIKRMLIKIFRKTQK